MKHTPGPWTVKITDEGPYFSEISIWSEDYGSIADLPQNWEIYSGDKNEAAAEHVFNEGKANAHIMALSLEMFDTLMEVNSVMSELLVQGEAREMLDNVKAMIKKATS